LVVWSLFRYYVHLPEAIEELWFKPVLWLMPLWWLSAVNLGPNGVFKGRVVRALLMGFVVGLLYWLVVSLANGKVLAKSSLEIIGVSLATAIVECLVFAGYFAQVWSSRFGKGIAMVASGMVFGLVRMPIALFVYGMSVGESLILVSVAASVGMVASWLFLTTNNLVASIVAVWAWLSITL